MSNKMVTIVVTFRDELGGVWLAAGEINDTIARGDERRSLTEIHKEGKRIFITDISVVIEGED